MVGLGCPVCEGVRLPEQGASPVFISTRSSGPYLSKSLSISRGCASYSKFPAQQFPTLLVGWKVRCKHGPVLNPSMQHQCLLMKLERPLTAEDGRWSPIATHVFVLPGFGLGRLTTIASAGSCVTRPPADASP